MEFIVVLVTAPTEEDAAKIANALVEEKLAACVNIIKGVRSIYSWQGKVEDDSEVLMVIKTKKSLFEKLSQRVVQLHGYEVPECVAIPITDGLKAYTDWIAEVTE